MSLYLLFAATILFFALTRTQAGRAELKRQIEEQFSSRFEGSVEVGTLEGNVVYALLARDVTIRDPDGDVVARIDTVRAYPSWTGLLRRSLDFGRLNIRGAAFFVSRDSTGMWNVDRAFRQRVFRPDSARAFKGAEVVLPRLTITRSSLTLRDATRRPHAVADGSVMDFGNATYLIDQARIAAGWTRESRQVDVIALRGSVADRPLNVTSGTAQVVMEGNRIDVNDIEIETPGSRFSAVASFGVGADPEAPFNLNISADQLDPAELTAVFPSQPFRLQLGARLDVSGSIPDFVVHEAVVSFGRSEISAGGLGGVDADSVRVDATFRSPYVSADDIAALLPAYSLDRFSAVDSVAGEVFLQARLGRGALSDADFVANLQTELQSAAGGVSSTVELARTAADFTYTANVSAADVDLAAASGGMLPPSLITGSAFLEGESFDPTLASGRIDVRLEESWYGDVHFDSLRIAALATTGRYDGRMDLREAGGRLASDFIADASPTRFTIRGEVVSEGFDIARLAADTAWSATLTGTSEFTWQTEGPNHDGQLSTNLLAGTVRRGRFERELPASDTYAAYLSDDAGLRARVEGDLVEGSIESALRLEALAAWLPELGRLVQTEAELLAPDALLSDGPPLEDTTSRRHIPPGEVSFSVRLRDDSTLAALATLSDLRLSDLRLRGVFASDTAGVTLFGESSAHQVSRRRQVVLRPAVTLSAFAAAGGSPVGTRFDADATADAFSDAARSLANPAVRVQYSDGSGTLAFRATESETVGPIDVEGSFDAGSQWTGRFSRFLVQADDYRLSVDGSHELSFHRDAVAVRGLRFVSPTGDGELQTLRIEGRYSSAATDTLQVDADNVDLTSLSLLAGAGDRLSGNARADLHVFRASGVPVVAGIAEVTRFGLDDRILGDLVASSRFRRGSNAIDVSASLLPARSAQAEHATEVVVNDISLNGEVRLDDGLAGLDFAADVRQADLFFFEYIFPHTISDVRGSLTGTARITGTFGKPLFEATLRLPAGTFRVPEFNVDLGIEADITVDARAIQITRASITDSGGGVAAVAGDILFNDYRYFSLDLTGDLDDFQIMNVSDSDDLPFYGDIRGSGPVTLQGPISGATLRMPDATTNPDSDVYIPIVEPIGLSDDAYIVFADSTGTPLPREVSERTSVLGQRPASERTFLEGLALDLNIFAPPGSTIHLVIDPLLGDVMNAVGTGRVQIRRREGEFTTFGQLEVNSGDYLFTAGDVFVRRFEINRGGTITWDGDPTNAILDVSASYATRASRAGLPGSDGSGGAIPLIVRLRITGRVATPEVALSLEVDRTNRDLSGNYAALEEILNQPSRATEYATSVLVTNSFLLTTTEVRSDVLASSAFNSVSQLVASQINRYLNEALPNVDFSFGVQGESTQELGVTYGIALRLLDERLVIRGQGVYQGARSSATDVGGQNLEGEFVVEVRLNPTVSVEVFYRREGDVLTNNATLTGSTGAGLSYRTEFTSWRRFFSRIFGTSRPAENTPDS